MKRFSHYAKKRFKSLSDHLIDFSEDPKPELLHKIRLEVKKIKAVLNVTEFSVNGFKSHKKYLPFRTIFREAGEIRQADVVEELFRKYKIKTTLFGKEKTKLDDTLIPSFQNNLPSFLSTLKKRRKLFDSFKDVKHSCFKKYLGLKKEELRKNLYPRLDLKNLHKTRKTVKEILYLSPITRKSSKNLDPFYDKLQVMIGQWHDKQIVVALLKAGKNSVEVKQLKAACWNDIKNIRELIRQFYQP